MEEGKTAALVVETRAAVGAALHHSRDVGPRTTHDALRGQKPAAAETETEFFQMSEGDSVGETVGMYGARPALLMVPKVQARVRHTGVGYELVQALDVPVLHGLEVADDINDRATLQLLRGLALVPQERVQHGSVEQVSSFGVQLAPHERVLQRSEQVGVVHGMVEQVVDVPARGAETFHVPPDSELAVHVTPEFELAQEEHVDDGGYVSDEFFDDDELPSRFRLPSGP